VVNVIPYGRHLIDQNDIDAVVKVLQGGWLTCGPVVERFEQRLAEVVSAKHVISCSNGTTALHLAMVALGVKSGDVVLVPTITFLASANAARYVDADVVFVDVDPTTGLMNAETLEVAILKHKDKPLKAVVNVHLAGQCEDLDSIHRVAKKYNLLIIEDAAHAIGTIYIDKNGKQQAIGSNAFSDITTFSFHPVKTIAMGEGGAVTTNDPEIANKLRLLRSHGMIRDSSQWHGNESGPWYYEMQELGFNYRISDINCALGFSQLEKLEEFKKERAQIISFYDESFSNSNYVTPAKKLKGSDTAWHLCIVFIDFEKTTETRAEVMKRLRNNGIGTQVHYVPVHTQPYYKKRYGNQSLPGAESYYKSCLSLPLYVGLRLEDQRKIINALL
jgi:UDP-4-amino-4,6-dideoxy-N-acetyl-beta-L-altrosamine transaminase